MRETKMLPGCSWPMQLGINGRHMCSRSLYAFDSNLVLFVRHFRESQLVTLRSYRECFFYYTQQTCTPLFSRTLADPTSGEARNPGRGTRGDQRLPGQFCNLRAKGLRCVLTRFVNCRLFSTQYLDTSPEISILIVAIFFSIIQSYPAYTKP